MKDDSLYVPYLGLMLALALVVLVTGHVLMFLAYYADTLAPTTLPYYQTFDDLKRLDYRQFGGQWRLQDGALVQLNAQDTDLFAVLPNLTVTPDKPYYFSAKMRMLAGPNGGGLLFNLQHADNRQQSHLVRFGNADGQNYLVYGYFDEKLNFVAQGTLPPPELAPEVVLGVAVHGAAYDVLVNGQPVVADIPLQYQGGHLALTTWFSSVAFDDVYATGAVPALPVALGGPAAQPATVVAPEAAAAPPMQSPGTTEVSAAAAPPVTEPQASLEYTDILTSAVDLFTTVGPANIYFAQPLGASADQSMWRALAGDWRWDADALVQTSVDGFDNAMVYANQFSEFGLRVQFQHRDGIGGGVLFNMPGVSAAKSGHLVRYVADNILAWGYFDERGIFQGQGSANVPAAGNGLHTFEVTAVGNVYAIRLDGEVVMQNIPLMIKQGRIGLTSSQSVVAFTRVEVSAITPQ